MELPIGCARKTADHQGVLDGIGLASVTHAEPINTSFKAWTSKAEDELCGIFDRVDPDGRADKKYKGRAIGLRIVNQRVLPNRAGHCSSTDDITLGLLWFKRALGDMVIFLTRFQQAMPTSMAARQWSAILQQVRRPHFTLVALYNYDEQWMRKAGIMAMLLPSSFHVVPLLKHWAREAAEQALSRSVAAGKVRSQAWWRWVDDQLRLGAGALHRFTKREVIPAAVCVAGPGRPAVSTQDLLDADRQSWGKIWTRFDGVAAAPWREALSPPSWAAALPAIQIKDVCMAARKFRRTIVLGVDSFNPRWLCMLSDGLLQAFAGLLGAVERVGAWPAAVQTLLIALIPKSGGGRRPIGLRPTLVRVWEKVRKPIVAKWRATIHRSYNYAGKGMSAQVAAWKQALRAEVAAASGGFSIAGLVDLVKAFEMVRLDLVWRVGLKLHCPPDILRLELEAFAMDRRLTMRGAVADSVWTLSAIVAGGAFATDLLFLLMIGPCDHLLVEHPGLELCLFVDDLTLHATGLRGAQVIRQFDVAINDCIKFLEEDLQLVVSRGSRDSKTVAVASRASTSARISAKLAKIGVRVVHQARLLGVDFSAGRKVRRGVQRSRISKVLKRKVGYLRIGRKAAAHLVKTGAGPALRYGAAVVGASSSAIRAARGFSCQAVGEMRGRSTFARLSLAGYDVGALMATDPIVDWACAVWDGTEGVDTLACAWKKAMVEVCTATRPFSAVRGPAGAMVASALRLGWRIPSAFCLMRSDSSLVDLRKMAPRVVSLLALHDLQENEAAGSSLAKRIDGPPDLEPLRGHLHLIRRTKAAGPLRALGEGGWWTQARMFAEQLPGVDDDVCKACNQASGTLYHRCCGCPAIVAIGRRSKHNGILDAAQTAIRCVDPLFQHGVPHLRRLPPPPPFVERWCGGIEVDGFCVTGSVFTDGALSGGARAGRWAVGSGHVIVRSGTLLWCRRCGAYAEERLKSLKVACGGPPGKGPRAGQLSRLLRGLHPLKKEQLPRPVGL